MLTRPCPNCGSDRYRHFLSEDRYRIVRCMFCSLTFLLNAEENSNLYEDYYCETDYDPAHYAVISPSKPLRELAVINGQRIALLKKLKKNGALLDIGCGFGFFVKSAAEAGYTAKGIDVSVRALDYAKKYYSADVSASTIQEIARSGKRFDIITLWHVTEHFTNPVYELSTVRSLLNHNGLCIAEVPNLYSVKFMLSKNKWDGGNHPKYHRSFFSAKTLAQTFQKAGFSDVRRLKMTYSLPTHSAAYTAMKRMLNEFAVDSFLIVHASG